jgi:hypothetical protein
MVKDMEDFYSPQMGVLLFPPCGDSLSLGLYNEHFCGRSNFRADLGIAHAGTKTIPHGSTLWATAILKIG